MLAKHVAHVSSRSTVTCDTLQCVRKWKLTNSSELSYFCFIKFARTLVYLVIWWSNIKIVNIYIINIFKFYNYQFILIYETIFIQWKSVYMNKILIFHFIYWPKIWKRYFFFIYIFFNLLLILLLLFYYRYI